MFPHRQITIPMNEAQPVVVPPPPESGGPFAWCGKGSIVETRSKKSPHWDSVRWKVWRPLSMWWWWALVQQACDFKGNLCGIKLAGRSKCAIMSPCLNLNDQVHEHGFLFRVLYMYDPLIDWNDCQKTETSSERKPKQLCPERVDIVPHGVIAIFSQPIAQTGRSPAPIRQPRFLPSAQHASLVSAPLNVVRTSYLLLYLR